MPVPDMGSPQVLYALGARLRVATPLSDADSPRTLRAPGRRS